LHALPKPLKDLDMSQILSIIADPEQAPLTAGLAAELGRLVAAPPVWLAPGEALELALPEGGGAALRAAAREMLEVRALPADLNLLPAAGREKRLLISDMDSTMITVECIDELADFAGVKAEVAAITRRAMAGELDFAKALEARVALLEGLPADIFAEVYRERVRPMAGAATLVRTMAARGAVTALVSGGFMPFAERVRDELGFDQAVANRLETADGRLTGRVLRPILGADAKLQTMRRLLQDHGLGPADALAVGDGANDLPMLVAAGLGVAFRAHAPVAAAAGVQIEVGNLSAVLYLQGIPKNVSFSG
jgi:phosphoserine phosphatase